MKTGFVICSRVDSHRVPGKAFIKYNGKPHIEHLVDRLVKTDIPVYIAVPEGEEIHYAFLLDKYPKRVFISAGFANDPLRRMHGVVKAHDLDVVIRVTHDKIFVDTDRVFKMLNEFHARALDYMYSSSFIPGTGYEIISARGIAIAAAHFKRVEHVSYAMKSVLEPTQQACVEFMDMKNGPRLLVDYPEDVELMNLIFATLGSDASMADVVDFICKNPWVRNINRLPKVTVYTCAYNAEKWIDQAMGSVASQENFKDVEFILIDDCSSDRTAFLIAKFCQIYKNARWMRNQTNRGLATSSNIALKEARGKYIVRLDADDFFSSVSAIQDMIDRMEEDEVDAVYPNNYFGVARKSVQQGKNHHHIGGTLFRTAAINHVKFTEEMRNLEGLDFFTRARGQIKIGYLNKPVFVYRQHDGSMSKNNLEMRLLTRQLIEGTYEEKISVAKPD